MDPTLLTVTAACAVLAAVVLTVVAGVLAYRRLRAELRSTRAKLAALQARVDRVATTGPVQEPVRDDEFLITTLPSLASDHVAGAAEDRRVSGADVVSVAVGESLVRVVSLAHGLRRALSAENRNRIGFEVRREVRRSRKQRRRDVREAQRHLRTQARPGPAPAPAAGSARDAA